MVGQKVRKVHEQEPVFGYQKEAEEEGEKVQEEVQEHQEHFDQDCVSRNYDAYHIQRAVSILQFL